MAPQHRPIPCLTDLQKLTYRGCRNCQRGSIGFLGPSWSHSMGRRHSMGDPKQDAKPPSKVGDWTCRKCETCSSQHPGRSGKVRSWKLRISAHICADQWHVRAMSVVWSWFDWFDANILDLNLGFRCRFPIWNPWTIPRPSRHGDRTDETWPCTLRSSNHHEGL